ncbi:Meiotic nuclear division protein 1 [Binucleata daphniae]
MAKKLKAEEKCQIMLKIFQSKRDFFQLKDIEKMAVKKGITAQTVKETLQSLVDDNLVVQEKLGISNYYWSFANDIGKNLQEQQEKYINENEDAKLYIQELMQTIEDAKKGREDTETRTNLLQKIKELENEKKKQEEEMKKYAQCDPRVFMKKKEEISEIKKEINKLTDNIYAFQTYVCDKFGMERNDFCNNFNVSEEMDYCE